MAVYLLHHVTIVMSAKLIIVPELCELCQVAISVGWQRHYTLSLILKPRSIYPQIWIYLSSNVHRIIAKRGI